MRKIGYISLMLLAAFALSCSKTKSKNNQLPDSLKQVLNANYLCACIGAIDEYVWRGQTIYASKLGGPACDPIAPIMYYYEDGTSTTTLEAAYTHDQFLQESRFVQNWYDRLQDCAEYKQNN